MKLQAFDDIIFSHCSGSGIFNKVRFGRGRNNDKTQIIFFIDTLLFRFNDKLFDFSPVFKFLGLYINKMVLIKQALKLKIVLKSLLCIY